MADENHNPIYDANRKLIAFMLHTDEPKRRYYSAVIRRACIIPYAKYAGWLQCKARIEPLYQKKIEEVLGQRIF